MLWYSLGKGLDGAGGNAVDRSLMPGMGWGGLEGQAKQSARCCSNLIHNIAKCLSAANGWCSFAGYTSCLESAYKRSSQARSLEHVGDLQHSKLQARHPSSSSGMCRMEAWSYIKF